MTSQLLDKTCEEIITITADLDDSSKRLIDWHMKIIHAMDHEISLIPDIITRAIDSIDMEANYNTEALKSISKGLAGFVHSLYFFAKAKYQSIVKKSRQAATQLLEQSVYLLINNLETLVSSAVQGTAALFTTLRQVFTGDKQWIKNGSSVFVMQWTGAIRDGTLI